MTAMPRREAFTERWSELLAVYFWPSLALLHARCSLRHRPSELRKPPDGGFPTIAGG